MTTNDTANAQSQGSRLIKMAMASRGLTNAELAAKLEVSDSMMSQLISGSKRSKDKERKLCRILGISHDLLWPKGDE